VGYLRVVEIALLHSWRWAATLGAGYGRAARSAPVRRLKRMLLGLRLGYECGAADGWFGVADAETLRILRLRDGLAEGAERRAVARSSVISPPPAWPRADASATQYDGRHNAGRVVGLVLNGSAHDARPPAPRRGRAGTRNGSRDKRAEPIATPWRRKRR
jgi:hypothetical protein